MSVTRRQFNSEVDFETWHEQAKSALDLPRVGVNAATGEATPSVGPTTGFTELETDEDGNPLLTAVVANPTSPTKLEDVATIIRADRLTSEEMTTLAEAFPPWQLEEVVAVGDLRSFDGRLWKCLQAHTTQADWEPPIVPALWLDTAPPDVIPEWRQPTGAHDAYNLGDRVTHNGQIWESLVNANVWEPGTPGTEALWSAV